MATATEARVVWRLAPLTIDAAVLLGWAVALGMCSISFYILHGFFSFERDTLGRVLGWIGGPGKWLQSKIEVAEHKVTHWVGQAAASSEQHVGDAFHAVALLSRSLAHEIEGQAIASWHIISWVGKLAGDVASGEAWQEVFHNTIRAQSETTAQMFKRLANQQKTLGRTEAPGRIAGKRTVVKASAAGVLAATAIALPGLREQTRQREDALAKDQAGTRARTAEAEHGLGATRHRVGGLEKALAGAGAAALTVTALARVGVDWLTCSNVRAFNKRLCRTDPRALENLLAGTLAVFGTISILEFAKELQAIVDVETAAIHRLIREK